jgi:carbon-monoxide dehydrogenase iron sulfur subunit
MKVISLDGERLLPEERCGDCRLCEAICALVHEGVANPKRSRIRVFSRFTDDHRLIFEQIVCQQCADEDVPPCAQACPSDAIYEDEESGLWKVNSDECTGCGVCADECPYGAIFVDPVALVALKCDLCGGQPQCVAVCPANVLALVEG